MKGKESRADWRGQRGRRKNTWMGRAWVRIRILRKFSFMTPAVVNTNREDRGNPLKNAD